MVKAPKRKGKLATALAGQQQVQQQRQAEERARQAQIDRDRAKQLKANRQQHHHAGGPADLKGKKRARPQDDDQVDAEPTAARTEEGQRVLTKSGPAVQPFKKGERTLLVGEGNFSFAHALLRPVSVSAAAAATTTAAAASSSTTPPPAAVATAEPVQPLVTPSLLCCTAYDTESVAAEKYPDLATHVDALRDAGATVLFGVDGTNLASSKEVRQFAGFTPTGPVRGGKKERRRVKGKGRMLEGWANRLDGLQEEADGEDRSVGFDKIVFNFPHVGQGITDQARNVRANQTLLLDFYRSAAPLLRTGKAHALSSSAKANHGRPDTGSDNDDDGDDDEDLLLEGQAAAQEASDIANLGLLGDPSMQAGIAAPAAPPPSANRGTVLLTLRTNGPYASWLPSQLATKPSLLLPSIYPPHELKLRSTPQRGGEQPRYRTVRSWKFEMRKWEQEGYEHRRTIGYEEKYAELGGGATSKNADLAMTARERKLRRIEAAKAAKAGLGEGDDDEEADDDAAATPRPASRQPAQPEQQHDIRTWEFELVTPEDEASSRRGGRGVGGGGKSSASKRGGAGASSGPGRPRGGKFKVGGADDPDLMSD
ncbi:hypothetical protein JCM3774_001649 [Rhodotorula dairenensis]